MNNPSTTTNTTTTGNVTVMNWNDVTEPGVYVDTEYPRYYRVTNDCLTSNGNPGIQCNDFTVAKISTNPTIPAGEIKTFCTTNNLPAAF